MPSDGGALAVAERDPAVALTLVIPGEALAVRAALARMLAAPPLRDLPETARANAEIVLAEALNNVVEHAYAAGPGAIEVTLAGVPGWLDCQIVDRGLPMPGLSLPAGRLPAAEPSGPPEGGFGWHLIRSLACDLVYRRSGGCNRLSFRLSSD